jgi:hypothetical protein
MNRSTERGSVLILTAISMLTLVAIAALSLSASFAYDRRNQLGAAADDAAKSAATELLRTPSLTTAQLQNFANQAVQAHGFTPTATACDTPTTTAVSVCVYKPPQDGAFTSTAGYVEVTVQQQTNVFLGLLSGGYLRPLNRAVAGYANPSNCFITFANLNLGLPGGGGSHMDMGGCGVAVGGQANAGTSVNVKIVYSDTQASPAPVSISSGICNSSRCPLGDFNGSTSPAPTDPLSSLPDYTSPTGVNCPAGAAGTAATLSPGCYTSIATTVQTLTAGNYYITGRVQINQITATGGVMLYLACPAGTAPCSGSNAGGNLAATNSGGTHFLNIVAANSGTYEGIAIFQDRQNFTPWDAMIDNSFTLDLTGAIYSPKADLTFSNSFSVSSTGCSILIANSYTVKDGAGQFLNTNCASDFGGAAFLTVSLAE